MLRSPIVKLMCLMCVMGFQLKASTSIFCNVKSTKLDKALAQISCFILCNYYNVMI